MIKILLLIIIYISYISLGLPDSLLGSSWPSMYGDFGVPISYAGIVSIITAGGTFLSSLFSARIIKKAGIGKVVAISVFMTAAALLGVSFCHSFFTLCIYAIPLGFGAGCIDAALNNYVAIHYEARHMSWLHCFWGLGATTGPIVISFWLATGNWKMGYVTIGILQSILVIILVISLPLWKKAAGKDEKEAEMNTRVETLSMKEIVQIPGTKSVLTAFFCYCAIEATTGLWGSSFLVMSKGIDVKTAASLISLFYFGITFGRFLSGFITYKLNQKQMIRFGQAFIILGIVILIIPGTKALLLPGLFIIGLGCAPIYPSLMHETPENFGVQNSQAIMGAQMASASVGYTLIPPVFGFLANKIGYGLFQPFIGCFLIVMIIMVEILNKKVIKG